MVLNSKRKSQSQWILSSYNSDVELYPDSLDRDTSIQLPATSDTSNSSIHNFQTANNFLWTVNKNAEYYDSIDSNKDDVIVIEDDGDGDDINNIHSHFDYSLYDQQQNDDGDGGGEDLAEYDSLEKRMTDVSLK